MATEYTCITRKIEVHLHCTEENKKELYGIWDTINDNLYKAANYISSHLFFNDAYIERLKVQSNSYRDLERDLKKCKDKEKIQKIKSQLKELENSFKAQRLLFLKGGDIEGAGSEKTAVRRLAVNAFPDIPYSIINALNDVICKTYTQNRFDVAIGKRTIATYKKGMPVPFLMTTGVGKIALRKREDNKYFVLFPGGLEWDLSFGRDSSNNQEIVARIMNGKYKACDSSIQQNKKGKYFLNLVVKIPKDSRTLNPDCVVGVDLGINTPLCAALNDNQYGGMSIGSRDQFLKMRMRMSAQKRDLQRTLRHSTNGGHGRKQKLQALERLEGKERNWVHLQNHIFSKTLIEYALKSEAGVIQMERLTGFGRDKFDDVDDGYKFILRYWSFFELQTMIEYKANAAGIEVRYVNPYHTSQTCSFCGHYEKGQRINQSTFVCKNPECKKGKGDKRSDGTYKGINADWNAARNIALSKDIVDRKKK